MMSKQSPPTIRHDQLERELKTLRFSLEKAENKLKSGAILLGISLSLSAAVLILFAFV